MLVLFSTFPKSRAVHTNQIELCHRLYIEFLHYVIASKSLRKVSRIVSAVLCTTKFEAPDICGPRCRQDFSAFNIITSSDIIHRKIWKINDLMGMNEDLTLIHYL